MTSTRNAKVARLAMAVLLAATAALYLYRLGDAPVHVSMDEAKLAAQAHSLATTGRDMRGNAFPLFVLIVDPLLPEQHSVAWWQPALFYTTAAVYRVAGVSEWSTRLPVALLSVLNVWLAYLVASRWLGGRWYGVCAAAVLAMTPAHFILGREAADYFCPTTVCLVWLWSLGRFAEQPTPGRAAATGMVLGLGLYSYITSWVVMPMYLVLTLAACWRLRAARTVAGAVIAAFAICALPAVLFAISHPAMFGEVADHYKVSGGMRVIQRVTLFWDYFNPSYLFFAGGSNLQWSTRTAGVYALSLVALLPSGLWGALRPYASVFAWVIVAAFLLVPLPIVAAMPEAPFYATARAVLAAPLGALLAAAGLKVLVEHCTGAARVIAALLLVLIPLQFAAFARDYFGDYRLRSAPWIDALNFRAIADRVIELDHVRAVPAVYLSHDDIGEDKAVKWRFHLLTSGRMDLWSRTQYLAPDQQSAETHPAGSVLVVAAANQRRAELESRGWSAVAAIPDAAGNTAAIVLQKP